MKNSTIYIIVSLGILVIAVTFYILYAWMSKAFDQQEKRFSQTVQVALIEVAKKSSGNENYELPQINPVKKLAPDYYLVNIGDKIDAGILEFYLVNEFEKMGIKTDFEYAVYDCNTDKMIYGNYVSSDKTAAKKKSLTVFPKHEGLVYYFVVRFPEYTRYTLSSVRFLTGVSILSILFLIFMAYAIFIILYQMRFSQLQKDFINNMTHEFKTPISSVSLAADSIQLDEKIRGDAKLSRYVAMIKNQNQKLNILVEKVLHLAMAEKRSFKLQKKEILLDEFLSSVVSDIQLKLQSGGNISYSANNQNIKIWADEIHFFNIVHTLIDNAIKYSTDNPEISVGSEQSGNCVIISVSDNGIGIDKKFYRKVFQKFFRIPTGNVHNVKGYGIGLYYVKKISRKHGWDTILESESGKGTTIKLIIKNFCSNDKNK